jgi:coatomer subunit beta'
LGHSQIRVYNYNTSEKITSFEAHPDYIRAIVVHPTQPFVLTASDDMTIKLWDWEKGWKNVRVFEGNSRMWTTQSKAVSGRDTNSASRLRYVPGHQPQGHKYLCLGLLGQDR